MVLAASALLTLLSVPVLFSAAYLFLLAAASFERPAPPYGDPRLRFDFVVPAHDEQNGIAETVRSLLDVDYPPQNRRVLVVADNCSDATAARAEAAGATVLVRNDSARRGKGYALKHGFDRSLADGLADAVVVIDADSVASRNLLRAFAARFEAGAKAAQAEYGVRNPRASWRTRLMVIALATFHAARSLGRERLGVSCGLRGNGMAFTREVIESVPHEAFSLVEDLEYGIRLACAGYAVRYVHEASVLGEMVPSERASRSQRRRWESGRVTMMRTQGLPLLRRGLAERKKVLLDLALDVLVPPLTYLVGAALLGTAAAVAVCAWGGRSYVFVVAPWAAALLMLVAYVARGVVLSKTGARGLLDLAWAPAYMAWKVLLSFSPSARDRSEWIRTAREDNKR